MDIVLQFIPSEIELTSNEVADLYLKKLTGFYTSLVTLEEQLSKKFYELKTREERSMFPMLKRFNHIGIMHGKKVAQYSPPEIATYLLEIATPGGIGLAFYKILQLWVKVINGRKLMVKIGEIEVEATQLSRKKFNLLLAEIKKLHEESSDAEEKEKFTGNLKTDGILLNSDDVLMERFTNIKNQAKKKLPMKNSPSKSSKKR